MTGSGGSAGSPAGARTEKLAREAEKRVAAEAAARLVEDGMVVGLGTGSTVAYLLVALAGRRPRARYVATSPRTERSARELGLTVERFGATARLDLALDGADQVARNGWLVKGGGAAHTREKVVAATADRFVVMVDSSKGVDAVRPPVPLELLAFGVESTLRRLSAIGPVVRRDAEPSPDGGVICDYLGPVEDPEWLAGVLAAVPGVVEHGLFPPALVSDVIEGRRSQAVWTRGR